MKKKTSITLSPKLLKMIDALPDQPPRSFVIEQALILYFKSRKARERDASDLEILNQRFQEHGKEALDVLGYQSV